MYDSRLQIGRMMSSNRALFLRSVGVPTLGFVSLPPPGYGFARARSPLPIAPVWTNSERASGLGVRKLGLGRTGAERAPLKERHAASVVRRSSVFVWRMASAVASRLWWTRAPPGRRGLWACGVGAVKWTYRLAWPPYRFYLQIVFNQLHSTHPLRIVNFGYII